MTRQLRALTCLLSSSTLTFASVAAAQNAPPTQAPASLQHTQLEEITVTATRSEQSISRVPLSIAAYTQEDLDSQGVRSIDEVTRLTPGVQFNRSGYGLTSSIAIRGIASSAGSATTGVYIDDTPVQVRAIGNSASNLYPAVFDLERVEVLRGPQGTLFGAGSQGGTVRFITPSPGLGALQSYSRAEIATTQNGEPSYEIGSALGGGIIDGKLGFRVSGFARRDGGFVDRVPYPDGNGANPSRGFPEEDSNSVETYSGRIALTWQPTEALAITPSVFYQDLQSNGTSQYWVRVGDTQISDIDAHEYINGDKIASTNEDEFTLPALKVRWGLGSVTLASDTSYLRRRESGIYDYGAFINNIFGFGSDPTPTLSIPGNYDVGRLSNSQNNLTQEFRINSNDPDAAVTYVIGAFWTRAKQESHQDIVNPYFESIVGMPVEFFYGLPRSPEGFIYVDEFHTTDEQIAAFGEINWEFIEGLKVTAGLRVAKTELEFRTTRDGPAQGGPGADAGKQEEEPVTPKLGLSYQINDAHMIYATAAKGFRIGGVNRGIPTNATCDEDLAAIGLTSAPTTYDSDTVWSYEVGSKNRFADGTVRVATSAYYIKWKDIVNSVGLPNCGFSFTDNLGSATVKGFDLEAELQPIDSLTLALAVGYNRGTYDETIASGGPKNLVTAGYTTGGNPWVVSASSQYDFAVANVASYVRVDFSYRSQNTLPTDTTDPHSPDFDPLVPRNPSIKDLRLRAGIALDDLDLSAFVNNATNESYLLNVDHVTQYGRIFSATAVRPITYGVTATYRF